MGPAGDGDVDELIGVVTARARALAPEAVVAVDGDQLVVLLPGVTRSSRADDFLTSQAGVTVAVASSQESVDPDPSAPERCGLPATGGDWVCHPTDARLAFEVWQRVDLGRAEQASVDGSSVTLEFAAKAAETLAKMSAEAACFRDADGFGKLLLLVGGQPILAATPDPDVVCGEGTVSGSITVTVETKAGARRLAAEMAGALPFDVVTHTVEKVLLDPQVSPSGGLPAG